MKNFHCLFFTTSLIYENWMKISHMKTGPLVAVDKQIDNVEDVQGRPGEEEDHAHAHQNPDHLNI